MMTLLGQECAWQRVGIAQASSRPRSTTPEAEAVRQAHRQPPLIQEMLYDMAVSIETARLLGYRAQMPS